MQGVPVHPEEAVRKALARKEEVGRKPEWLDIINQFSRREGAS
jgi:hypothetical protein